MAYTPNPELYKIRLFLPSEVRDALIAEQGRRQVKTGKKTPLIDIASEWLTTFAASHRHSPVLE